ncbi:hypothetical protein GGU11DRAFT_109208 [Lentinula aff. detonsa]|nr:hypothetical protein GGU11DRAFT_109208 [Lentinula aff. detonsa]
MFFLLPFFRGCLLLRPPDNISPQLICLRYKEPSCLLPRILSRLSYLSESDSHLPKSPHPKVVLPCVHAFEFLCMIFYAMHVGCHPFPSRPRLESEPRDSSKQIFQDRSLIDQGSSKLFTPYGGSASSRASSQISNLKVHFSISFNSWTNSSMTLE